MEMPEGWNTLKKWDEETEFGKSWTLKDGLEIMKEMAEALEDAYHEQPGTRNPTKVEIVLKKFKEWK